MEGGKYMDDDPKSVMKTKNEYYLLIIELLKACNDIEILDFICQLLRKHTCMWLRE